MSCGRAGRRSAIGREAIREIAGYETPDQIGMLCCHGGGRELLQKAFDTYTGATVQVVGCGAIAREFFTSEIPIRGISRA